MVPIERNVSGSGYLAGRMKVSLYGYEVYRHQRSLEGSSRAGEQTCRASAPYLTTKLNRAWSHSKCAVMQVNRTTVNNGYLGSRNDEERSEMRYVMRIAEFSESSNL